MQLEVRLRLTRAVQLGPYAGVVGRQRVVEQSRPKAAHIGGELARLGRIDGIVLAVHIGQVRPEHRLPAQVFAIVGAQRARDRRRIDQPVERRPSRQAEIDALAIVRLRDPACRIAVDAPGGVLGLKPRSRDQKARGQNGAARSARRDAEAAAGQRLGPLERRPDHDRPSRVLDLALQRQHIAVAVEHTALGGQQRRLDPQLGLHRQGLSRREPLHAFHVVGDRLIKDGVQPLDLVRLGRDDQLAALPVLDLVAFQKGIEGAPPLDAEPRLQRASRIIEAAVNDLGVARRHPLTDRAFLFQDQHRQSPRRERTTAGQADRAGAHHRRVEVEAQAIRLCGAEP